MNTHLPERRNPIVWWMDQCFRVPGTNIRFGFDALIGLVPGLGDWVTNSIQAYLVLSLLAQKKVPGVVAMRMVANVAIDGAIGAVPLVGDVFDIFFKANSKNYRLFESVQHDLTHRGEVSTARHWAFFAVVAISLVAVLTATAFLAVKAVGALLALAQGR